MNTKSKHQPDAYLKLVRDFPLKTIRTAADHKAAMKHPLFSRPEESLNGDEIEYLRVLATLIEQYEAKALPIVKAPVHERLRFLVEESEMGQAALAKLLGIGQPAISLILSGKRGLTTEAVRRLADHFHVSPAYFIG